MQFFQPIHSVFLFGKFGINFCNACVNSIHFMFDDFAFFGSAIFILIPNFKTENVAQDFFAFGGILLGELICLALQKERCVDKGLVIEPQGLFDAGLGIACGLLG